MSKDQRIYLNDILERIDRIQQIMVAGEATIRNSFMHQDTIIRNFEVIGEIVKRLEPGLTSQVSGISWSGYARFCDLLIHEYDKVILDIVLEAVENDLEPLKAAVQELLKGLGDSDNKGNE